MKNAESKMCESEHEATDAVSELVMAWAEEKNAQDDLYKYPLFYEAKGFYLKNA